MKQFIITEQQVNAVLAILGEIPAKISIAAIDILRNGLSEYIEKTEAAQIESE